MDDASTALQSADLFGSNDHDGCDDYLSDLNPPQREAVESVDGPLLILAGAGTGKTKVLTTRVAHILRTGRAWPSQILTVTFTNKASGEMKSRISRIVGDRGETMPWMGTFHSLSARILRRHAELVGLKTNFNILDSDDVLRIIKQLLEAENIDPNHLAPRTVAHVIDQWKNEGWTPDEVPENRKTAYKGNVHKIFAQYQGRLKILNAADFGDLLVHVLQILKSYPDLLESYHRKFKFILVDEYQDTNVAQYLWLRLLSRGSGNICCVGDDDQSIYAWRGAQVRNILDFQKNFPDAKIVRLEQNYRSTQHILSAASGLITQNKGRLGKTLWTAAHGGDKLTILQHADGQAEAAWICSKIEELTRGDGRNSALSLDDTAILVRAASLMRVLEERLIALRINYRVFGGPRFYERREIRDALAYLRLIRSQQDDLAFERVVNLPLRGVGQKTLLKIRSRSQEYGISMLETSQQMLNSGELSGRAESGMRSFLSGMTVWSDNVKRYSLQQVARQVLDESGLTRMWSESDDPRGPDRLENLAELVEAMSKFEDLESFLDHVSLVLENFEERREPSVSLMTMHAAKGTEFQAVFLPAWEEGCFPSRLAIEEHELRGLEEERRLAYVAITRAMATCVISCARVRSLFGTTDAVLPSRFLSELPKEDCNIIRASQRSAVRPRPYSVQRQPVRSISSDTGRSTFSTGDRVFHQKFGNGDVISSMGDRITVEFDAAGRKTTLASYLSAAARPEA